jgi:hypothetical protein
LANPCLEQLFERGYRRNRLLIGLSRRTVKRSHSPLHKETCAAAGAHSSWPAKITGCLKLPLTVEAFELCTTAGLVLKFYILLRCGTLKSVVLVRIFSCIMSFPTPCIASLNALKTHFSCTNRKAPFSAAGSRADFLRLCANCASARVQNAGGGRSHFLRSAGVWAGVCKNAFAVLAQGPQSAVGWLAGWRTVRRPQLPSAGSRADKASCRQARAAALSPF